jgi:hypothetical protein
MSARLNRQTAAQEKMARRFGIATSRELLIAPLRYDWSLIDRDINTLLRRERDLSSSSSGGPVGQRIPEAFVNYMAALYLACCRVEKRPPPESLLHLISEQLNVATFGLQGGTSKTLDEAQRLRALDPAMSNRKLAAAVKVNPAQVSKWIAAGDLPASQAVAS